MKKFTLTQISNLPEPSGITLTLISGGVRIDFTDNSEGAATTQVFGSTDGVTFTLLTTLAKTIKTYSHLATPIDRRYYRLHSNLTGTFSKITSISSIAMLGPEIVVNGGFDNGNNWVCQQNPPWSIYGGVAVNTGGPGGEMFQYLQIVIGHTYRFQVDVSGNGNAKYWYVSGLVETEELEEGHMDRLCVCSLSHQALAIYSLIGAAEFALDNVSLKEVLVP